MEFLIPVPDNDYYLWQMLVQIAHFREMDYEQDAHYLVVYFDQPSHRLRRLFESEELGCFIHAYPDTREDKSYSASMKPWLLGQFFEQFPEQSSKVFNYLDPDVMFTKPMDFSPFEQPDGRWYGSDTRSYTGAQYIREKGEQLFLELCQIADVCPDLVLKHDHHSIGAQYFIKGAGADFWRNVEHKSVSAYRHMIETADKYKPENHEFPIQAWCAEMYMQQFETVRAGFTPIADERLQFHWADADASTWVEKAYFHNAGQTKETGRHFCKITWQTSPFHKEITVSPESASSRYVDLIKRTEKMFPDLVWSDGETGERHVEERPNNKAGDYVRAAIPDELVHDLAGREIPLRNLAADNAALLLYATPHTEEGRRILQRIPALLTLVPHLRVLTVLTGRSELAAVPPEARRQAIFDPDNRTHQAWRIEQGEVGAVLLGIDGLLAGGPVHGADAVERFAEDIRDAIVSVLPVPPEPDTTDDTLSIDVLIPYRNAAPERLRNLIYTIGYYRRHLPAARIVLAEQNDLSQLPEGLLVDHRIAVPGDPDLFNRSLLLNAAAAESTATHLVFADGDCIPEVGILASLEGLAELLSMTYIVPHSRVHYLSPASTNDFIVGMRDHDGDLPVADDEASHVTVGGVTFCSYELFHRMGGFDQQRFLGWGGEDDDLYNRCLVSHYETARIPSELVHLHHPGSVWHSFGEEEMVAKRSKIRPQILPSPDSRLKEVRSSPATV